MSPPFAMAALLLAGMSVSLPASAANYLFATPLAPSLPFVDSKLVAGPSFVDRWSFNAPATAVSVTGVVNTLTNPAFNIDNVMIELYTAGDLLVSRGAAGELSELDNVAVSPGAAYYFQVSGEVVGSPSGFYSFSAIASAVPEPATGLLLLAGAGLVIGRGRRAARA